MEEFEYTACQPPLCKCPTLEVYKDIDGKTTVSITDDYAGCVIMEPDEMALICRKFLSVYDTGEY